MQPTSPEITKSVGRVSSVNGCMKTAAGSRAEVKIKDVTVRIGASTLCCFDADGNVKLKSGVVFFSKKKRLRGDVQTDSVIIIGSDFLISNVGATKVIALKRRIGVGFVDKPAKLTRLSQGQMLAIEPGARVMPKKTEINLEALLSSSMLGEAGGLGAFPEQPASAIAGESATPAISAMRAAQTAQVAENIAKQGQEQQAAAMAIQQQAAQQAAAERQAAIDRAFLAQQRREELLAQQAQQQQATAQVARQQEQRQQQPNQGQGSTPSQGQGQGSPQGNQGQMLGRTGQAPGQQR
jgi:hypothetical protein